MHDKELPSKSSLQISLYNWHIGLRKQVIITVGKVTDLLCYREGKETEFMGEHHNV